MTDNQPQPYQLPDTDDSMESIANYERLVDGDSGAATAARALLAEAATLEASEIHLRLRNGRQETTSDRPAEGNGRHRLARPLRPLRRRCSDSEIPAGHLSGGIQADGERALRHHRAAQRRFRRQTLLLCG